MTVLLSLAAHQHLSISPRMQQAIRLLRLSAMDFELALRNAAVSNPFLEDGEDAVVDAATDTGLPGTPDMPGVPALPESFAFERTASAPPPDDEGPEFARIAERQDLRDHLRSQLLASRQSPRALVAANLVIEMLDDDGYLRDDPCAACGAVDIDPPLTSAEIDEGIALLRQFDPPGLGARSLIECLCLQLDAIDALTPGHALARTILETQVDLLARRDFCTLQRRLQCDETALNEAIALIRRLDPDPGSRYRARAPDYVVPDVVVVERDGRYSAVLNPAVRAGIRLNERYIDLFRQCRRSQHPAMAQQLQEARWMVRNVEQRFDTILRVASFIVERQQAFFSAGDLALKPMVLREVADELGLHESTVSRATGNKYMATARGCLEFKHFFSRELHTDRGAGCSAAAVRSLIGGLIDSERRCSPLSDVEIAAELKAQGIRIARRTVTKYRRMLKVPSAEFRRVG